MPAGLFRAQFFGGEFLGGGEGVGDGGELWRIDRQAGVGDDPRLASLGITGTGTAGDFKFGVIPTITGLVFVAGGDDKLHVYDAETGKQLWERALGAASRGIPSMYEQNGRQFLLMTASDPGVGPNRNLRPDLPHGSARFLTEDLEDALHTRLPECP